MTYPLTDVPPTRGMLVHNLEEGRSACMRPGCGWRGPTPYIPRDGNAGPGGGRFLPRRPGDGELSHECPVCDVAPATDAEFARMRSTLHVATPPPVPKVSRNAPCPCGSSKKAKKCCHA